MVKNFLQADLKRLYKRVPLMIVVVLMFIIHAIMLIYAYKKDGTSIAYMGMVNTSFQLFSVFLGIVEFGAIFTDFMRANAIQVAMGQGISRRQIILFKYLEIAIVLFFNLLVLALITLILAPILGVHLAGSQVADLLITFFSYWFTNIGVMSFAMIAIFGFNATTVGLIVYLFFSFDLDSIALALLKNIKGLEFLTLENYVFAQQVKRFTAHLYLGNFSFGNFFLALLYVVIAIAIARQLFDKREIEL